MKFGCVLEPLQEVDDEDLEDQMMAFGSMGVAENSLLHRFQSVCNRRLIQGNGTEHLLIDGEMPAIIYMFLQCLDKF